MASLKTLLQARDIHLDDDFLHKAQTYKTILMQWNKTHNLTGAKTIAQIDDFIVDSVEPVTFLPPMSNAMDIGTGAGFPGMILAFALPNTHFTLVEPLAKRASFLQFIKANLALNNVTIKAVRVEQLEPQTFDMITSRAVTETQMLLKLSHPFRTTGTLCLFYKGEKVYDEVDESLNYTIIEKYNRHYLLIES